MTSALQSPGMTTTVKFVKMPQEDLTCPITNVKGVNFSYCSFIGYRPTFPWENFFKKSNDISSSESGDDDNSKIR